MACSWPVRALSALVVLTGAAASGRATASTTRAVPDLSTNHSSADRIVVNSYNCPFNRISLLTHALTLIWTVIEFKTQISNYITLFNVVVITYPCPGILTTADWGSGYPNVLNFRDFIRFFTVFCQHANKTYHIINPNSTRLLITNRPNKPYNWVCETELCLPCFPILLTPPNRWTNNNCQLIIGPNLQLTKRQSDFPQFPHTNNIIPHSALQSSTEYINGLVQERRNSSALTMELHLYCTNSLICQIRFL